MGVDWSSQLPLFLLAFSSLLPLVNPLAAALIITPYLATLEKKERRYAALKIVMYCFFVGFIAIHAGSPILKFMGVSISTTLLTGGLIVAKLGWGMLETNQEVKQDEGVKIPISDAVFYPLAFPITVGPGSIATLITLSAQAQSVQTLETGNMLGITLALLAILMITYFCFIYATQLTKTIGRSGSLVLNRLMAFLLCSIGIQMAFTGLMQMIKNQS
jgi:multiple antibiotic resistance protein